MWFRRRAVLELGGAAAGGAIWCALTRKPGEEGGTSTMFLAWASGSMWTDSHPSFTRLPHKWFPLTAWLWLWHYSERYLDKPLRLGCHFPYPVFLFNTANGGVAGTLTTDRHCLELIESTTDSSKVNQTQSEALCCQTLCSSETLVPSKTVGQFEAIIQDHSHSQANSHPLFRKQGKCVWQRFRV